MLDILNLPTLILDGIHRPIEISNARESICDILLNKAMSILDRDAIVRSPRFSMNVPNVVLMYNGCCSTTAKWSRLNTIYRDDMQCCYCGKKSNNIKMFNVDHIILKCRFNLFLKDKNLQNKFMKYTGLTTIPKHKDDWLNTICSCKKCNNKKRYKFIWENGYELIKKPFIPKYTPKIILSVEYAEKHNWTPYLEKHNGINIRLV